MWFAAGVESIWLLNASTGMLVGAGVAGTAAGSLGQFLVVPLVQGLIDYSDWQFALHMMAVATLLMPYCRSLWPRALIGGCSLVFLFVVLM
jgi:hypothetical protein